MPVYEYTALDKAGKTVNGIIDADSSVAARQKLRGTGKFPVELKETVAKVKAGGARPFSFLASFQHIKAEEIHVITRQLSTLVGAGIPLIAALDGLIQQAPGAALKKVLSQVKESINEGNSLEHSLARHPKLFSNIYINMVRAGEASGSLDVVLDRLAEFGEQQQALRGRFKAALVYPLFMGVVGTAVLFFLITFVVPNITSIFTEMEQALPVPTTILIGVSVFLRSFWWVLGLGIVALVIGGREMIKRPGARYVWDEMKLRLPVFGDINRQMVMSRFARTMGSLLQSGVPVLSALYIVRNIVNNELIAEVIDDAALEIQAGKSMNVALARSKWFPPMFIQMVSAGEQSGDLEAMLSKVADAYEREVESKIMGMTALIEPTMILVMAFFVGFVVISILLPIFEMNQMIS